MIEILEFTGSWCRPCKQLESIMHEIEREHRGINVSYINVEQEPELANKYHVLGVPALIFMKNGEMVERLSGLRTKVEIEDVLENLGV